MEIVFEQEISVEAILKTSAEDTLTVSPNRQSTINNHQSKYPPMPEEKIYGMGAVDLPVRETLAGKEIPLGNVCPLCSSTFLLTGALPSTRDKTKGEAWVDFLTHSISTLAKDYHAKMEWLDKMNRDAPVELHNPIVELYNTLHDTLVDGIVEDILKFKDEPTVVNSNTYEYVRKAHQRQGLMVEQCLKKGYEISFETDKKGILCRLLSEAIGVNAVAANWREALAQAIKQIPLSNCVSGVPNSLFFVDTR